jgi:hypothetical protein
LPYRLLPPVGATPHQPACLAPLGRLTPMLAPECRSLPHARATRYLRRSHSRTLRTASAPLPLFVSRLVARLVFPHVAASLRCSAARACIPACVLGHLPMPLALPSRPLFNPQWSIQWLPPLCLPFTSMRPCNDNQWPDSLILPGTCANTCMHAPTPEIVTSFTPSETVVATKTINGRPSPADVSISRCPTSLFCNASPQSIAALPFPFPLLVNGDLPSFLVKKRPQSPW